jgi:hypothetical protein
MREGRGWLGQFPDPWPIRIAEPLRVGCFISGHFFLDHAAPTVTSTGIAVVT